MLIDVIVKYMLDGQHLRLPAYLIRYMSCLANGNAQINTNTTTFNGVGTAPLKVQASRIL